MKGMNGSCLFAYEIQLVHGTKRQCHQSSPKSLPDIQRSSDTGMYARVYRMVKSTYSVNTTLPLILHFIYQGTKV